MTTCIGIANTLTEIKRLGWQQVADSNGEVTLTDDIDLDSIEHDSADYVIDADTVVRMRDGIRADTIWTREEEESAS